MAKRGKDEGDDDAELRRRAVERFHERRDGSAPELEGWPPETERLVHELQVHQIELELQNEELQRARAEVEQGLARYAELYELAPLGYLALGRDGEIRQVNLTGARLLGGERARLVGGRFGLLVAAESRPAFNAFLAQVFVGAAKELCELEILPTSGGRLTVELAGTASAGGPECRVVATDVTARRRVEQELIRLRRAVDTSNDAIFITDREGRITFVNPAFTLLYGFTADEVVGKATPRILKSPAATPRAHEELWTALLTQRAVRREHVNRTKDGRLVTVDASASAILDDGGTIIGFLAIQRDITERKHLEAVVAQSARMASMGILAASVAHEVANPLSYVLFNLESLAQDLPKVARAVTRLCDQMRDRVGVDAFAELVGDDAELLLPAHLEDAVECAREGLDGSLRIRAVTAGLGTFSRVELAEGAPVDLARTIEGAVKIAHNEIRHRARLIQELGTVPAVRGSEGRLAQVFLNLLINASHAIDEGDADHNSITIRTWAEGADVFVEVTDTGRGIPPEDLERIFQPFYSTKAIGQGAGLGLAICRNILVDLGGDVRVQSQVGVGSRFVVRLPAAATPATVATRDGRAATAPAPEGGAVRGRVLVVDDEEAIRAVLRRLLGRQHDVVTAVSGRDARSLIEEDAAFDVIICDLMMPDMTGVDLHAWLTIEKPDLAAKVVFLSGGAFTPRAVAYLATVEAPVIDKPFDSAALRALVASRVAAAKTKP